MKYNIPDRVLRDIFRIAEKNGIKKSYCSGRGQEVRTGKEVILTLR